MGHRRRLSYSLSIGVIVTALSYLFQHLGNSFLDDVGEGLAVPGYMGEIILYALTFSDEYDLPVWPDVWVVFNFLFYALIAYVLSWVITGAGEMAGKHDRH
jgi:hypothetical protein